MNMEVEWIVIDSQVVATEMLDLVCSSLMLKTQDLLGS